MNYAQQIKHPMWQKKRLEILTEHGFTCQECEAKDEELHVHHSFYRRGAMIWDYENKDLMCLCHKCHKDAHAIDERIKKSLSLMDQDAKWYVAGVLEAKELRSGIRFASGHNPNLCILKVENQWHCFGIADFFGVTPQDIWSALVDEHISLAWLEWHRAKRRSAQGLSFTPPITPEGADGPF